MVVDLHAHYPMHLVPEQEGDVLEALKTARGRRRLRDRVRAVLIGLASRVGNYRSFESGPRVTVPLLRDGNVGVVLSVLYSFFDEADPDAAFNSRPQPGYFARLLRQLEIVETDIATHHADDAVVARSPAAVDAAVAEGRIALVHCVEGGFHLGPGPADVDAAVAELARRGVAYITLAHLVYRDVATNAPALPFLPDPVYRLVFRQPKIGLTELGRAAIEAMVRERVLIDVSHMSGLALDDTFALLDRLAPDVPVIASHGAFRFGKQEYGFDARTLKRIAARDGVVGLIFAQHQLNDGLRKKPTKTLDESFEVLSRHIDRIADVTGSHRHVAIGSDFDGFIKPTLGGLESMQDMVPLQARLVDRYGVEDAERICAGNALRALHAGWGGAPG